MSNDLQRPFVEKPYVLDPPTQKLIIESLADGNYLSVACEAAGTTRQCFNHWRKRYEDGDPVAKVFADFFVAVKKAMAIGEQVSLRSVRGGVDGWQGSAWFLERRYPARWGKKDRAPVPPKPPKPLEDMSDKELDEFGRDLEA